MIPPFAIALVEDNHSMRRAISRLLAGEGWVVRDYASATEFLAALESSAFDCLLLDLRLPGMSGIEL